MFDAYGRFVNFGLPDEPLPGFNAISLLSHGTVFGGSHGAGRGGCVKILQLAMRKSMKL
jgi:hypothetical protein